MIEETFGRTVIQCLENWIKRSCNSVTPLKKKKKKKDEKEDDGIRHLASLARHRCEQRLSNICLVYVYAVSSSGVEPDLSGGLGAPATILATPYST